MDNRLIEIEGIRDGKDYEHITYRRIRDFLNIKTLKQIMIKDHLLLVDIHEENQHFTFQYPSKPRMYISKKDGRIYSEIANRDSRYQAYVILRILAKYGYIEEFKRIQRKKETIPFIQG